VSAGIGTLTSSPDQAVATPAWVDREAFPFRSHFLEIAPGRRVHYVDEGKGDVLLFVHGTPTWSFEWRHCIRELSRTHRCIAMDNLGFGLSDRPRDFDYTPESHARVLRAFVDRLGLTELTLVVHDFGGPIGLPLVLQESSVVRRLVVLNTWMWSFDDDPEMVRKGRMASGSVGRLLYRYANFSLRVLTPYAYADRTKLTPRIHQQYLAPFRDAESRERVLWPLARAILGSSRYYDSLWRMRDRLRDVPTLVIWGMKDPAFQPSLLARWKETLPQATVVELPVGHWPQEESPGDVTRAMQDFLARGTAGA
jgi:pimeloyl-ACP methyl ester carboxylesterase